MIGPPAREVIVALARALDEDDYSSVATLIHPQCDYAGPAGRSMKGRREVTGAYWRASRWAKERFTVRYESEVVEENGNVITVEFVDHLERHRKAHTHRCQQKFTVVDGLVTAIEHIELPGEKETLDAYFLEVEVARDLTPSIDDMGINFKTVHCPDCFARMPAARFPKTFRQFLWGGWTCHECGCEMDKFGKSLSKGKPR